MSLQQIFQIIQNWAGVQIPSAWSYEIPWSTLMWWGLGFLVIVMIRDFFGGFASGFMKGQTEQLIEKHKGQETKKTNAPRP